MEYICLHVRKKIHGTGILTYIWYKFITRNHVGKYSIPMDHLGWQVGHLGLPLGSLVWEVWDVEGSFALKVVGILCLTYGRTICLLDLSWNNGVIIATPYFIVRINEIPTNINLGGDFKYFMHVCSNLGKWSNLTSIGLKPPFIRKSHDLRVVNFFVDESNAKEIAMTDQWDWYIIWVFPKIGVPPNHPFE